MHQLPHPCASSSQAPFVALIPKSASQPVSDGLASLCLRRSLCRSSTFETTFVGMAPHLLHTGMISRISPTYSFRSPPCLHEGKLSALTCIRKPSRHQVLCQAASTQKDAQKSEKKPSATQSNDFPLFESVSDDDGELLPVRRPGNFPNTAVRNRWATCTDISIKLVFSGLIYIMSLPLKL